MSTSSRIEGRSPVRSRMKHPIQLIPEALPALQALNKVSSTSGISPTLLELVHLRASQINGCSYCVQLHATELRKQGESDARIFAVGAWRESTLFSDEERAALSLTEAATRLCDRSDPVPDEIFNEAARYFDELKLADLALHIAGINLWNRINVIVRTPAGALD